MWEVIGIILVIVTIILIDIPWCIKQKFKKEIIVFSILLSLGAIISFVYYFDITIPSPLNLIKYVFEPISRFIYGSSV